MYQIGVENSSKDRGMVLKSKAMEVQCFTGGNGRIQRKIETLGRQKSDFHYEYDASGHLTKVVQDGRIIEQYAYNKQGQRIEQRRMHGGAVGQTEGHVRYNEKGRLTKAGDTSYYYDKGGALCEQCDCRGITKYFYGKDTMLDKVLLPSGVEIRYEYDRNIPTGPTRKFKCGVLRAEYEWHDAVRLARFRDHVTALEYTFYYSTTGMLERIRLAPFQKRNADTMPNWMEQATEKEQQRKVQAFLSSLPSPLELHCGLDQVGTLKVLTLHNGQSVKITLRDSFGVVNHDTLPELFVPVGFAGGLYDADTGLTRFGFRDYAPQIGRFTAKDPLGDTGGDHDVYDYCIDDPVTMNDPAGLIAPYLVASALLTLGKAASVGIAMGATSAVAHGIDAIETKKKGEESHKAVEAIKKIEPRVRKIHDASFLPGEVVLHGAGGMLTPYLKRKVTQELRDELRSRLNNSEEK